MSYPINVEVDYVEKRSRLTTLVRLILAIPLMIVLYVYAIGLSFAVIIAWFAELITGRCPDGLYNFIGGVIRYYARVYAYSFLMTDTYAPFGLDDDPSYPVRVHIAPQPDGFSRLKVLLRIFYIIPAAIIVYVISLLFELAAIGAWLVILITGKQPEGLQNTLRFCLVYITRASGLFYLVTETYPPFGDEEGAQSAPPPPPPPAPEEPAPLTQE